MKVTTTLCALLVSTQMVAQKDQIKLVAYVVNYEFIAVRDTSNTTYHPPCAFTLVHHKGESRFHSNARHFNDSMLLEYRAAYPQYANPKTQESVQESVDHFLATSKNWRKANPVDYIVTKNFTTEKYQNVLPFAFPAQHMEETMKFDWSLGNQQDTILGLPCYMATCAYGGRTYTAWFAPSIPIPDGPYVFSGLPGLIVQISDQRNWYTFRLKDISVTPQTRFWKEPYINPKSRAISRQRYVEQSRQQKENPRVMGMVEDSEADLISLKERYQWRHQLLLESY